MLELHFTGRNGAELAPEHVREILTAPTSEFKAISLSGIIIALILAVLLRQQGPKALRVLTLAIAVVCALIYVAGYGIG